MADGWQERNRPARLERRYEFDTYSTIRDFLEKAADLSEEYDLYPNIGFSQSYVNFTIYPKQDNDTITEVERDFAQQVENLSQQFDT